MAALASFPSGLAAVRAAASPGEKPPGQKPQVGEADAFFDGGTIPLLRIEVAATNLNKLRGNARAYVPATIREGDRVYREVGLHVKGAAGSGRPVDDSKPAFTLNFDKFVDGQHFHGLDKLALNNSVQDPSYVTEAICSELFLAAGVPTPRTTHARVVFNGNDMGLFVLKQGFDKSFLRRHFKNVKGNLYDGGFIRDVTEPLDRTSSLGDVSDRADLKALVAAAGEPDLTRRFSRLEEVLDLDRFLSFVVLEMLTWHWDGYTLKRNNYRIYHDPDSRKLTFFPHGMDQMFWSAAGEIIPARGQAEGLVAQALLETKEGDRRYRERLGQIITNVFTLPRMTNQLNQLRARIRPVLEDFNPELARQHDAAVTNVLNQLIGRANMVRQKLTEPEPEPLRFATNGEAALIAWYPLDLRGTGQLDRPEEAGLKTLRIVTGAEGRCTASWRTRVILPAGTYSFTGRLRTAGVVPLAKDVNTKGLGAGLRQSQRQPRKHGFVGDTDWQGIEYDFTVARESEVVALVCELRAERGQAWFDLGSLKLRRKTAPK